MMALQTFGRSATRIYRHTILSKRKPRRNTAFYNATLQPEKSFLFMKNGFTEIKPFSGLGDLSFGMTREQAQSILGAPSEKETFSLDEDEDDRTEAWHYDEDGLSLSFDESAGWKLSSIAVSLEEYTLEGVSLVGKELEEVLNVFENKDWGELQEDDEMEEEMGGSRLFFVEEKGISLWFEGDVLTEVQWNAEADEEA